MAALAGAASEFAESIGTACIHFKNESNRFTLILIKNIQKFFFLALSLPMKNHTFQH